MASKKSDEIIIKTDRGTIEGYISNIHDADDVSNYLDNETQYGHDLIDALKDHVGKVAILESLHVNEDARGLGEGKKLLNEFMSRVNGVDAVILVADTYEPQSEGFVLDKFYESKSFKPVADAFGGPVMVWPPALAERIREQVGYEVDESYAENNKISKSFRP